MCKYHNETPLNNEYTLIKKREKLKINEKEEPEKSFENYAFSVS
jgi:hypothetical protein